MIDNCTGLMWQRDTVNWGVGWCEALYYCENLRLAGHDDWRLPNIRELESIVDYGRFAPPLDPLFEARIDGYWSSTSAAHFPDNAWFVGFGSGGASSYVKEVGFAVRAVRGRR